MIKTLRHRGPDAQNVWVSEAEGVVLAHARLSIIDLSAAGAQPMISTSGRHAITYNGEIYNAQQLIRLLEESGAAPAWRGHSDTEVLLACIEAWGVERALREAEGMFAFALWDRRDRRLVLARDRAGEKPLYYGWAGGQFVFASELKAIRAMPQFEPEIDRAALARFAQLRYVPAPLSIYRNVRKLRSASWLSVDLAGLRSKCWPMPVRYWSIEEVAAGGLADPLQDQGAAIDELDRTLRKAVLKQMSADVPLGAFLSGGVDSSLVVALMQAQSMRPIRTFTAAFEETRFDEGPFAAAVAAYLGTDHNEVRVTTDDARSVIPQLANMYDEPFADESQIPTHLIARMARTHVTVALSGDGGDELFGGYNRYRWLPTFQKIAETLPLSFRGLLAKGTFKASGTLLLLNMIDAGLSANLNRRIALLCDLLRSSTDSPALYDAALHAWQHAPVPTALPIANASRVQSLGDFQSDMMLWDYETYMQDDVLVKVDRASMATSLEVRCPFLDHNIANLAWRLPISMKIRGATGKWILRQVLPRYVPRGLIERPKAGFSVPIGVWIRGPLREWAEELLSPVLLRQQGYFESEVISEKWKHHCSGLYDFSRQLWPILMFQTWLVANFR